MKRKFEAVKTLQLLATIALAAAGLIVIFRDNRLYQMVGRDPSVCALCILLWLALGIAFVGIFWDFTTHSSFKKDYRELDYAVCNDPVAGIANRYSCDAMIEKYLDAPLPDHLGCAMLDLLNLREINETHGRAKGNESIQEFANILYSASLGLCFVGRNGGTKFLALFEDCDEDKIEAFLEGVHGRMRAINSDSRHAPIQYRWGRAFHEDREIAGIHRLVALADRRLYDSNA